jgi:MoxR-like ATPase
MQTQASELSRNVIANIERVIVGKRDPIELALAAVFAEGHILMEDVPGVGKTMLCRALSRSFHCSFKRLQFTPDLLPTDITGFSVFNQKHQEFEFRPGPLFSQFLLADEINRATPKTQSALLESMGERQATIDGTTLPLPEPFVVLATQNPIEYEGTFPLPEAQLDRFLVRLKMGYPRPVEETEMLDRMRTTHPIHSLEPVSSQEDLKQVQAACKQIIGDRTVLAYIVELVSATRNHPDIYLGASPRGSLALLHMSQALAMINGRDFIVPDDVKRAAPPVLAHRLLLKTEARLRGEDGDSVVTSILKSVAVPLEIN